MSVCVLNVKYLPGTFFALALLFQFGCNSELMFTDAIDRRQTAESFLGDSDGIEDSYPDETIEPINPANPSDPISPMPPAEQPPDTSPVVPPPPAVIPPSAPGFRKVLLILDEKLSTEIQPSINQWIIDLADDGFQVETVKWPRSDSKNPASSHIRLAKEIIWPRIEKTADLHVQIVGQIAIPYTGLDQWPDGHSDSVGAYPALIYYAIPSNEWTDTKDNRTQAQKSRQINIPGDGKFDQSTAPGNRNPQGQELGGRPRAAIAYLNLSFAKQNNWPQIKAASPEEFQIAAYNRYFANNHAFRKGQWPATTNIHSSYSGKAWLTWKNQMPNTPFFRYWAASSSQPKAMQDSLPYGIWFDFKSVTQDTNFWAAHEINTVLSLFFGSYQIDFPAAPRLQNPLMSGALATGCWTWDAWKLDRFIKGGTAGETWQDSAANSVGNTYRNLLGDVTIRLKYN